MSTHADSQLRTAPPSSFTPGRGILLQRKCVCGTHTMAGGECAECAKKKTVYNESLPLAQAMIRGRNKGVGVRRREAGGESRMKESYKVRPSQSPWPRVMRVVGQPAGRSVHRGTTGLCMELRTHLSAVADLVLTRGRQ